MGFKVGDIVQVRSWDDMKEEFGVKSSTGSIDCPFAFTDEMAEFCGNQYTIESIHESSWHNEPVWTVELDGMYSFTIATQMLEPVIDETIPEGIEIPDISTLF